MNCKGKILGTMFFLLGVSAVVPVASVAFAEGPGGAIQRLEKFINDYNGIILSLGTLFLVLAMALLTTVLAARFADKREASNRKTSAQMKLSEFRQGWINSLRDDLAQLVSLTSKDYKETDIFRMKELDSRIRMRLNPNEKSADELSNKVRALVDAAELYLRKEALDNTGDTVQVPLKKEELVKHARKYLKNEWDVLKINLETADKSLDG